MAIDFFRSFLMHDHESLSFLFFVLFPLPDVISFLPRSRVALAITCGGSAMGAVEPQGRYGCLWGESVVCLCGWGALEEGM